MRLIVPLDGTAAAEAVLPAVARLAQPLAMDVLLLRIVPPPAPQALERPRLAVAQVGDVRVEADQYLRRVADQLVASGVAKVDTAVRVGETAAQIVEGAVEHEADFIAMTTQARTALGRLLFGSVADDVVRQTDIPVLLCRATEAVAVRRAA